jgi:hypothetical protein
MSPEADFYLNISNWSEKDIESVKTLPQFRVVDRPVAKMRVTRWASGVVLSDDNPADLPTNDFHVVPVYAKKRGKRFWGKVEVVKDVQREVNKRHSQAIDIGNKAVAYGWFYDDTTFADSQEKEKFKRTATSPGFMSQLTDATRPPAQVEGARFPSEIVNLMEMSADRLSTMLNISADPGGANDSGTKLLQIRQAKLTGNEYLFDALSFAKRKLGRLIVGLVQWHYPPERLYKLLNAEASKKPFNVGGQDFSQFSEDEVVGLLTDQDLTKVDVTVSESTHSPTERLGTFMIMSELAGKGLQVPMQSLIRVAPVSEQVRVEMQQDYEAQQAAAAESETAANKTEINKTLIAKGIIPPEVKADLGMQAQQAIPGEEQMQNQNDGPPQGVPAVGMQ